MNGVLDDVASVQLERIVLPGEDDGGIERAGAAGRTVCDKVDVREMRGVACEIGGRSGLGLGSNGSAGRVEVQLDAFDLRRGLGKSRVVGAGRNGIADEQQVTLARRR